MLKTRNLNSQFAFLFLRLTENRKLKWPEKLDIAGVSAGLPFVRVSQEITFPTHKHVFVFTLLSVTCQTTLAALDNSALTTTLCQ